MSTPIANVALTNTFNNWRIRTNRIVKRINAFARTESSLQKLSKESFNCAKA